MPRKKQEPIEEDVARAVGGLLRGLRKAGRYRAVRDAAQVPGCPAAPQTLYAYERGGLVPSLRQFLELVNFYVGGEDASTEARYQGVAAIHAALASPAYHVDEALRLIQRLQPPPMPGRRRRATPSTSKAASAKASPAKAASRSARKTTRKR